jgi:hypothetical protein
MRSRPISVWLSATWGVAESHEINIQSACLRLLIMESHSFYFSLAMRWFRREIKPARDMPGLWLTESGYVLRKHRRDSLSPRVAGIVRIPARLSLPKTSSGLWRWKSKGPMGRPKIDKEFLELIKRMSLEIPLWGTRRIQAA